RRAFRLRTSPKAGNTLQCPRALEVAAGPRLSHRNWLRKSAGQIPATLCSFLHCRKNNQGVNMSRNQWMKAGLMITLCVFAQLTSVESARAQARATVASLRTQYNTVKTQAKPTGELKKKFDALD